MMKADSSVKQNRWGGETTAFLALFLDNAGVLIFLSAILVFTFNYPVDIILTRMIPGTAIGVFLGDLVYTWLAIRRTKKWARPGDTHWPLAC
jgi:AGZA family xanthine/uracil permease-like MFS transporter